MQIAEKIISAYEPLLESGKDFELLGSVSRPFPRFSGEELVELIDFAIPKMRALPSLLRFTGEITVIGDIHGNLRDLIRLLCLNRSPDRGFLFLGDYVDRGEFSVEVMTLVLAMFVIDTERVLLIRGNHEFRDVCSVYGFFDEIQMKFCHDKLFNKFVDVMELMPIAAVVNDRAFCVHAGLSPLLVSLNVIEMMNRPPENSQLLTDLVWSDPCKEGGFSSNTKREGAQLFGKKAVDDFLDANDLCVIVRGHQFVPLGVRQMGRVVTVFSSSNYQECKKSNSCGFVSIGKDGSIRKVSLDAIKCLKYCKAHFSRPYG